MALRRSEPEQGLGDSPSHQVSLRPGRAHSGGWAGDVPLTGER